MAWHGGSDTCVRPHLRQCSALGRPSTCFWRWLSCVQLRHGGEAPRETAAGLALVCAAAAAAVLALTCVRECKLSGPGRVHAWPFP